MGGGGEGKARCGGFIVKTVLLWRHAKSSRPLDGTSDEKQPLAKRGIRAASRVGEFLAQGDRLPPRILISPALRARETVEIAVRSGKWRADVVAVPDLYGAAPDDVLRLLREESDETQSVLLVGHEPTWSALSSGLIGGGRLRFPTAALARIDVGVSRWSNMDFGRGHLVWFVTPRLLVDGDHP